MKFKFEISSVGGVRYLRSKKLNYSRKAHFSSEAMKWIGRHPFNAFKVLKLKHTISDILKVKNISSNALSIYFLQHDQKIFATKISVQFKKLCVWTSQPVKNSSASVQTSQIWN